jgi:hypothetical protein
LQQQLIHRHRTRHPGAKGVESDAGRAGRFSDQLPRQLNQPLSRWHRQHERDSCGHHRSNEYTLLIAARSLSEAYDHDHVGGEDQQKKASGEDGRAERTSGVRPPELREEQACRHGDQAERTDNEEPAGVTKQDVESDLTRAHCHADESAGHHPQLARIGHSVRNV